jgi:hypothetical protein
MEVRMCAQCDKYFPRFTGSSESLENRNAVGTGDIWSVIESAYRRIPDKVDRILFKKKKIEANKM